MKTKIILIVLAVTSVFTFSCKKAALNQPDVIAAQPAGNSSLINKNTSASGKGGTILFEATSADLAAFEAAFNASVAGSITGSGRPPACGVLVDHASMLKRVRALGNLCSGTAPIELTYEWLVFEGPLAIDPSPSSFAFTVTDQVSNTYTGTYLNPPTQSTLSCNPIINSCGHVFTYDEITVVMNQADFMATTSTTNTVTGTGPGGCGTTISIPHTVGTVDCGFYLNNPARVYILPQTGQTHIYTDCSVGNCFTLLFQCPTGGTFEYRLQGTTGWPNAPVTLGPNGATINGLIANQMYEYRATLNYAYTGCSGTSQLATGVFMAQ